MKFYLLFALFFTSCEFSDDMMDSNQQAQVERSLMNERGTTLIERFNTPIGYKRSTSPTGFANYLRTLSLYPPEKKVLLFDGSLKANQLAQAAVIKMDVGQRDLQQCADAVMRLRAEYLYREKKYDDLHFNFTNGFNAQYSVWRKGKGISVKGNKVRWIQSSASNGTYVSFRKYMDKVFMFAGTASLEKELAQKKIKEIEAGDVFIKGGHPGHAVLVVDVASAANGDKVFMLAQSYMPAQEIHILKNPNNNAISPWYKLSEIDNLIETPEWTFDSNQLRTFR